MKRLISYIVVHATGTLPSASLEGIKNYWKNEKKWNNPGYHYIILSDGEVEKLQDESLIANGVKGFNKVSIHVGYIGGKNKKGEYVDTRTQKQKEAMMNLLISLSEKYPDALILGHRDFTGVKKACPCFDVRRWLQEYVPNFKNIA